MWKKVRVNKKYGEWEYEKVTPKEDSTIEFPYYNFKRVDKPNAKFNCGTLAYYDDMIVVIKEDEENQEDVYQHIE